MSLRSDTEALGRIFWTSLTWAGRDGGYLVRSYALGHMFCGDYGLCEAVVLV